MVGGQTMLYKKLILDVGSGPNGGISNFIQGAQTCVALDPLIKQGLFNLEENIETVAGIGECLPFQNNKFDIIFTINMLDHVYDPSLVLKEVHRVLSKEGMLCFMVNILKPWEKALNLAIERPLRFVFRRNIPRIYRTLL